MTTVTAILDRHTTDHTGTLDDYRAGGVRA